MLTREGIEVFRFRIRYFGFDNKSESIFSEEQPIYVWATNARQARSNAMMNYVPNCDIMSVIRED